MKVPLIVLVLLVVVEAHQGWPFYGPGVGNGRGNYPNRRGNNPWYPQQQTQNNAFGSDVEWVCQNPKTNDVMIIATDDTRREHPNPGRSWWQNAPPGHQADHHHHGNEWSQPIVIVQEPTSTNNNQLPPQTSERPNNNNDNQPQSTPHYHGGEGSIDIRMGQ